jgi:hypothetical protein
MSLFYLMGCDRMDCYGILERAVVVVWWVDLQPPV